MMIRAGSRYPSMTSMRWTARGIGIVDSLCQKVPA
jgi:hypothetical protein